MKKICFALALVLVLSLALSACGGAPAPSAAPASEAQPADAASTAPASEAAPEDAGAGTLVMATEATFPPYEYMSGSDIVGVDVDIAKEIAAELGLELVIEEMPFDAVIAAVDSGKADFAAAGISITEERKQTVDFSIEYATSKQVILTKADSGIAGEADLNGKTVGVQLGTVADLALTDDYPEVVVERYNKYTDAVNDLINGRVDALVLDSLPAESLKTMDESLVICDNELFTDVYAICVKKGNTELLSTIDAVLQRLISEGKVDEFTQAHLA